MIEPVLDMRDVRWACNGRPVLAGVGLQVAPGECVAICGENGAGKTTLLHIIAGLRRADGGEVHHQGGIGLVHQHFSLVPALSVAENVFLGCEPMRFGLFDRASAEAQTTLLAEKAQLEIAPRARVETLTIGQRQRVELLKALRTAERLLLLDEPTAVLGPREIDGFLRLIASLKRSGLAVVFVSHKLAEVARIADRVLVLRNGRIVLEARPNETPLQAIADAMVGEQSAHGGGRAASSAERRTIALLDHACAGAGRDRIEGVSARFESHSISGIAGVEGNGQHGLFATLVGLLRLDSGAYRVEGEEVRGCVGARAAGVRAVPADRHAFALLPGHDVADQLRLGGEDPQDPDALLERFDVRPRELGYDAMALSGGNQQKLVFARELGGQKPPRLFVVHEPTRGVDFLAKERLWNEIRSARDAGAAVVVISSDLDELRALCDRVLVLFRGRVVSENNVDDASDERLAAAMAGL